MTSTRSSSSGSKGPGNTKGAQGFSGRPSDVTRRLSSDEKIDNIFEIVSTLQHDMNVQIKSLREEIKEENKELVERLGGRIFELEEQNSKLTQTVERLEQKVIELEDKQYQIAYKQNDLEQHGRKNSIRIIGLEDTDKHESAEGCVSKIVGFVKSKLKVNIQEKDIDIAHRLDPYQTNKPRSVICKFVCRRKKIEVIRNRKALKGSKCFISEDLTQVNQQKLRDAFQLPCVERSWSMDGKLFVLLKNGRKRRLQNDTPLCEKFLLDDKTFPRF
ncbi:uncharacterized protein LOC132555364 [Ylistrum balloti]|uniref:uncharacterized protein LOC132555364 n=1 Tax=Ylistrum balloti TaxID=509963 RepID=UPI002905AEF6|nr:uncharacterized protein LOC132555364 [Ylistrum balloti]